MPNDNIIYTTTEQQIDNLKKQGLIINDENRARHALQTYGYSNLIKSYRDPYTIIQQGKKIFRSGTSWEQIYSLYAFDKNLRNAVMASMVDLEEHIKAVAADVIGNSFGTHQDDYLQFKNYRDKKRSKYRFSLAGILESMNKTLNTDKDPIAHYATVHGVVPPWILLKSVYFSTIVNFINLMKPAQQRMIAERLYDSDKINISEDSLLPLMLDSLFICLEYRNIAAHGGRIYNFNCNNKLRFLENSSYELQGFSQLLFILSLLRYSSPYKHLKQVLDNVISKHCNQFPGDITYLGQILNINIVAKETVWITKGSEKYHSLQHCSGMKHAIEIEFSEAQSHGFTPCNRCCK